MLYQPPPSRFLQFLGSTGTIVGEVPIFDLWVVLRISVIAPQTEGDDSAFGFGAAASTTRPLLQPLDERRVGLGSHGFRNTPFLLGCVFAGASAKFDGAFAVVISLHGKTTDALAVSGALPIVPGEITIMTVAHSAPNVPLTRLRPSFALLPARAAPRSHVRLDSVSPLGSNSCRTGGHAQWLLDQRSTAHDRAADLPSLRGAFLHGFFRQSTTVLIRRCCQSW